MEIIKESLSNLERKAAEIINTQISELLKTQKEITFAIPGGRSVSGVFSELKNQNIDWKKVHIFVTDEKLVPLIDSESNYNQAQEHLLITLQKQKKITKRNLHPFDYEKMSLEDYSKELEKKNGKLDIILLSVGDDGHIASLFPNKRSLDELGNFVLEEDSPKPPKKRMSASRHLIEDAQVCILLFFGPQKKQAFETFLNKSITYKDCPAKITKLANKLFVLTDN
jgi:6-phosphogluconolactonase